ncbi:hypothetical protein C8D92_101348 [Tamilnaduibacter salinus]|uniref:DUF2931 family protein n=1 Tax=Tamilnaduibacter salinus TaxID=1484056 RepID=A0A2A2I5W3_9GAMM|nr:DUF2931 family protein [Tamilnaduibacter salinus]PAV26696.1 hypothetical protein CF392_04310 [Tamilnaduibacter salinus]PVY79141.1 hypothetical protein C8D92_101348 [Tamilnaduibacter salinus]
MTTGRTSFLTGRSGVAALGLFLLLAGCATQPVNMDVAWGYGVAAPNHYRMWVERLALIDASGESAEKTVGFVSCCWQGPNGPFGKIDRMAPFPRQLAIRWFSFAEQAFYQTRITLPKDLKQRMRETAPVKTGGDVYQRPRNTLMIGLAPGGTVVLWMMSQVGNEQEILRVQADKAPGNPAQYEKWTRAYLEKQREYLKENGVPTSGW